jgi:hypothetical protein
MGPVTWILLHVIHIHILLIEHYHHTYHSIIDVEHDQSEYGFYPQEMMQMMTRRCPSNEAAVL